MNHTHHPQNEQNRNPRSFLLHHYENNRCKLCCRVSTKEKPIPTRIFTVKATHGINKKINPPSSPLSRYLPKYVPT